MWGLLNTVRIFTKMCFLTYVQQLFLSLSLERVHSLIPDDVEIIKRLQNREKLNAREELIQKFNLLLWNIS